MTMFKHAFLLIEDKHQELAVLKRAAVCLGKALTSITIYRHTRLTKPSDAVAWLAWQESETNAFKAVLADFDLDISINCLFTHKGFSPQEFDRSLNQSGADVVFSLNSEQSFLNGLFQSSHEHYFVADCAIPVWIVKLRLWDNNIEVLACLDVDDESDINHQLNTDILQISEQLAKQLMGQLHVIDCFWGEVCSMSFEVDKSGRFKRLASVKTQHQSLIQNYIGQYSLPEQSLHIVEGTPDFAIPDKASQLNAELVVIGNNADQGIMDRLFGDTAINLVNNVECDILVIKP
jgi:nucleotide-binding universal stress UspA family protein